MDEGIKIKGMFRVAIRNEDGTLAGDSGWCENTVVNGGFRYFLVSTLGAIAGSLQVSHAGLGTGAGPAATDTSLGSEVGTRAAVTAATSSSSKAVLFTVTFNAGWHSSGSAYNISSIGLFNSSASGTLFAGNTYASSSCASNQAVNASYSISFT